MVSNPPSTTTDGMSNRPPKLMARLRRDIMEFQSNPYAGISMSILDEQITTACLVLTPQDGPLRGLKLHFDVVLPENWPTSPPKVRCSYGLEHPNIFGGWYGEKGAYVCCDLLKTEGEYYAEESYNGGYHPGLTLRAIALQLLSFFGSRVVEQDGGGAVVLGDEVYTMYHHGHVNDDATLQQYATKFDYGYGSGSKNKQQLEKAADAEFQVAMEKHKPQKQFKYMGSEQTMSEDKAGRWEGWLRNEEAPGAEMEIVTAGSIVRMRKRNPRWTRSYNKLRHFSCQKCGLNTDTPPVDLDLVKPLKFTLDRLDGNMWTASEWKTEKSIKDAAAAAISSIELSEKQTKVCYLDNLNNDVLLCISDKMESETIISFSAAYPRFKALTAAAHTLILRELECFFLRTRINSPGNILGIGVHVETYQKALSSTFDLLSFEAFRDYRVRKALDKSNFEYFLPLWFSREHYARAKDVIWDRLQLLQNGIGLKIPNLRDGRLIAWGTRVRVLYKFMNNTVVNLMKSADQLMPSNASQGNYYSAGVSTSKKSLLLASEKSVNAYCQLFQLLLKISQTRPEIIRSCAEVITSFQNSERARNKNESPDLGEVIIMFCLVTLSRKNDFNATWANFVGPFMEENFTRNARWVLDKEPHLSILESGVSDNRLSLTFKHSKTSLRLVMFQVFFCKFIARIGEKLDVNYGYPPSSAAEMVVKEIKSIYAVDSWREYFRKVGYLRGTEWTKDKFCEKLRERVRESEKRGYHTQAMLRKAYKAKGGNARAAHADWAEGPQYLGRGQSWERGSTN